MKYIIYQLKDLAKSKYGLRSWNIAKENNFSIQDYEKVYTGSIEVENNCDDSIGSVLEKLFAEFNISRPEDFNGHSLSMSDVIALELANDNYAYYYCDTVGWKSVTEIVNKG